MDGEFYKFYYGKRGHTSFERSHPDGITFKTTITERYSIEGNESVYLCHKCVIKRRTRGELITGVVLAIIAAIFISLGIISTIPSPIPYVHSSKFTIISLLLCAGLIGLIFLIATFLTFRNVVRWNQAIIGNDNKKIRKLIYSFKEIEPKVNSSAEDAGDKIAVQLKSPDLRKQGFKVFFTRHQLGMLNPGKQNL